MLKRVGSPDQPTRLWFAPAETMCPACGTIHLISPRTPADVLDQRRLRLACARCGKRFSVKRDLQIWPRLIPQHAPWDE